MEEYITPSIEGAADSYVEGRALAFGPVAIAVAVAALYVATVTIGAGAVVGVSAFALWGRSDATN